MKSVAAGVSNEIRQDVVNTLEPVLEAEWNLNRYYRPIADNTPTEDTDGYDVELFPIESIVLPDRPTSGINKAIVGQSFVNDTYYKSPPDARYYSVSADDKYKYWQSPQISGTTSPYNISDCAPQVIYVEEEDVAGNPVPRTITANKISFTVENSYAYPDVYDVQVKTTTGGAWTTVASNLAIPADGKVELWWNGSAWTTTKVLTSSTTVHAVRLNVTSMAASFTPTAEKPFNGAYFNLIELGFRLELDLSDDIVGVNDEAQMGEVDFITPVGTVTSNTGSITLANEHEKYTNDNNASILYNLLDKNVEMNLVYRYTDGDVQQFKMYTDEWVEEDAQTTVSLVDGSRVLQDVKPQAIMATDVAVTEAIWTLLDSVGFTNYEVSSPASTPDMIIDIFWTTGEETVWEVLQQLSRGTQTAIYFDAYGKLQVKTKEAAFDDAQSPVWTFREYASGAEQPDIISVTETDSYEANKVVVNYQPTHFSEKKGQITQFEVVWEPEDTVTLRASELTRDLLVGETNIHIPQKDSKTWPWVGMVQIEGEWISYEGKKYAHYDANKDRQVSIVKSLAEQKALDEASHPQKRYLNDYTGVLVVKERALYNSEEKNHYNSPNGWTTRRIRNYSVPGNTDVKGFRHNKKDSTVTVSNGENADFNDYMYVHRGNAVDQGYYRIGTKMKIDKGGGSHKTAGIYFNSDAHGAGYYVEIMATSRMDGKMRQNRNELIFYSMKQDGSKKVFGGREADGPDDSKDNENGATIRNDMGARIPVVEDRYIELDVYYKNVGGDHKIQVWANGRLAIDTEVPDGSSWKHNFVSRFGMFARGNSSATYEYIYGIGTEIDLFTDEETFYDRIEDAYWGQQWYRDYVYETRRPTRRMKKRNIKRQQRYNQRFMDEFGPIVHEIREFDVEFDTGGVPVLESKIFHTNERQAVVTEYTHDVSGARFIMANTSRDNAVVNGEDNLTALGEDTIEQKLFIYGRPVIQKDSEKIERIDEFAKRRRGEIETEYDSQWIQNEEAAESLADWLATHWTRSDSRLDLEAFGNPLIEIGDVVAVEYKDMTAATHKYYVVGISTEYSEGLTTQFTLRRVS